MGARAHSPDLIVAGAGLAGLYAALRAAELGASVLLATKGSLRASSSFHAQGGIAAAVGPGDSPDEHLADTVRVGRGLCDAGAVRVLVSEAPARIAELERLGVVFDREGGRLALGREGGHGRRRILHARGSATGAAIAEALIARVGESPRIHVLEHTAVIGLLTADGRCGGAWLLGHDELRAVPARMTLLATGGAAALYARTTNPPGSVGDGVALAWRAGARVADMEFVQFHPTALAAGQQSSHGLTAVRATCYPSRSRGAFLVSEALRGEGAWLLGGAGQRFMLTEHPDAELAPRDVVAAAIQARLAQGETSYLSVAHLDSERIRRRFANLVEGCAQAGYDLLREPVPVAPAAHYLMGGVATDVEGETSVAGLYAAGECAATGVHGANRLASNSLLECFVFSRRAVDAGLAREQGARPEAGPPPRPNARSPLAELRRRMWRDAGVVRDEAGLARLLSWLDGQPDSNPALVARLVAAAALARTESRGAHRRADHPGEDPALAHPLPCPALHSTR